MSLGMDIPNENFWKVKIQDFEIALASHKGIMFVANYKRGFLICSS